ncbi:MAG: hypothetical protein PUH19_00575 [Faecalibacterium prausnitzii]|nr:hypothetical protein [Faecalibacterium prausnitzii]
MVMLLAHFLFHFPSFPAQAAIWRCFLPFSQLYPTAPGRICEMERWNPYPSKKGMNQKSPPLQESFRMSFTRTILQHHRDCKVEPCRNAHADGRC